jgi:hypothetical protein
MTALRSLLVAAALLLAAPVAPAAPPTLAAAHGSVDKVEGDTLTVKPRGADGRFGPALTLKVTGTSHVTVLAVQERAGKPVLTQRDSSARDLQPGQEVAVIYAAPAGGMVLLTAVAQPPGGR